MHTYILVSLKQRHLVACSNLPSIDGATIWLEQVANERFGEEVSSLLLGVFLVDGEFSRVEVSPEPVPLDEEILGAVSDTLIRHEIVRAHVVFKNTGVNHHVLNVFVWAVFSVGSFEMSNHFHDEALQREKGLEGIGQGGVFGFEG